jgi:aminopeptidase-like protein
MSLINLKQAGDHSDVGHRMHRLMGDLYPLCRSITGNGARETLRTLRAYVPLAIQEVPSGTKVFDWTVPKEWNIRDAWVKNSKNEKVINFKRSNLHVLNYSAPVHKKVTLNELKEHLFTLPEYPDWIPYRTSYYDENWGFCLAHNQYLKLEEDGYEVFVDASLEAGHLTYGEYCIEGKKSDEILLSCHICHPSLCNDNLSGIALCTFLAQYLSEQSLEYSYRFLFIPGTIGSITWLALNEAKTPNIKHGLVVACVGDSGNFTYKKTRRGDAEIDRVVSHVLERSGQSHEVTDFFPYGYDERQYCSPGFNLPVGSLMRTPHGKYAEYHTSADDLEFVRPEYLADSFSTYLSVLAVLENNHRYKNLNPKCEPQLGKRGLYHAIGGHDENKELQLAMLWVLNLADGRHTLLDMADRSQLNFDLLAEAARILVQHGLLEKL